MILFGRRCRGSQWDCFWQCLPQEAWEGKRKKKKEKEIHNYGTEGMCLGMCFGTAIGTAIENNTGIGITLGMLIGLAIGTCIKKEGQDNDQKK